MTAELFGTIFQTVVSISCTLIVAAATSWIAIVKIRKNAESAKEQVKASLDSAMLGYRAQVLSANRQAWINELRNLVSELAATLHSVRLDLLDGLSIAPEKHERMEFLFNKLRLMLNPNEPATIELVDAFEQVRVAVEKNARDEEAFKMGRTRVLDAASRILKSEWVRVKEGR